MGSLQDTRWLEMIEVIIIENHEMKTHRTATPQPDKRYMIVDHPSGDTWFIKHAEQQGVNALARKMLVKPTAGKTRP